MTKIRPTTAALLTGLTAVLLTATAPASAALAAPESHCVSEAVKMGTTSPVREPVCFASFAEAISYATDGTVNLAPTATSVTQDQLDRGRAAAVAKAGNRAIAADYLIGISYWDADEKGASWTFHHAAPCSATQAYYTDNVGPAWNDQISSARAYSGCRGYYYEDHYQRGGYITTPWTVGGYMNDSTTSVKWLAL